MSNKLSQFWQELKRRNVVRVITVYAGAAFVILELVDIVSPSLRLPEWTMNFMIVLLCAGFIIAVILSWVYDIHPEGGIVKTEPADRVKAEEITKSSNSWKIASYISFVVIVGLIILNVIPRNRKEAISEILDKSIAVLPFHNLSTDEENSYFIDGVMESILDNLCRIEDLRVVSSNSVQQYRNDPKPTPVVAEEMDVSYVMEGSGQKIGNKLLLTVQLIIGNEDRHIWSRQYDRAIEKVEDLLDIQKEVAQLVAEEIKAVITPEEQELIEIIPTKDLSAYDFYQRGMEELENGNANRANELFLDAISYDSTFASAYVGLAWVHDETYSGYFSEEYLDSVLILTNIALSYDKNLYNAYTTRARYYHQTGRFSLALNDLDQAIELNPNNANAYSLKSRIYYGSDLLEDLKVTHKSVSLDRTATLNMRLQNLAFSYEQAGFFDKSNYYYAEKCQLDGDSSWYYNFIAENDYWQGNLDKSIEAYKKSIAFNSTWERPLIYFARTLCEIGQCEESKDYVDKYNNLNEGKLTDFTMGQYHRVAYIYSQNGMKKETESFLNKQIEISESAINSNDPWAEKKYSYFDLAGAYAFKGEKEKAYENLRILNQIERAPYWLDALMKRDQLFDSIRDEPEFRQIARDIAAKYQAEHERVRQWLEENDML